MNKDESKMRDAETQALIEALSDSLTPYAVATIVSYLQPVQTKDAGVNREVYWFSEILVEAIGGYDTQNRLAEELGL